ncbi:MAG: energy transducer TonB [Spirosomataceae bacterium]|jgi:hypothetical protein
MRHITAIFLLTSIYFQAQAQSNNSEKDEVIFTTVGTPPSFPGGQDSLKTYLKRHVVYPQALLGSGIKEIAFVKLIVEKDGRISGIENMRECRREFLDEAERVAVNMPRWSPAKHAGKPVRCYYVVAIKFCPEGCAGE